MEATARVADNLISKANEFQAADHTARKLYALQSERHTFAKTLFSRADEIERAYLDRLSIIQQRAAATEAFRQVVKEAEDRAERAKTEAIMRETPIEKGAPGKINGGNKETREIQATQVLDEDPDYQAAKTELERCQSDLVQLKLQERAAEQEFSAYKALMDRHTAKLNAFAAL